MAERFDDIVTDLHSHSFFSDGRHSPQDVMAKRAKQHIDVVALSDHDVFTGVRSAHAAARALGMTLVPAMEATSTIGFGTPDVEQIHVLAYYPPSILDDGGLERTRLFARSQKLLSAWKDYALDFFSRQSEADCTAVDVDSLRNLSVVDFPGLQVLIDRIAARCEPLYPHFQLDHVHFWEHAGLFAWSPEELIDEIRADGALDVVAHPIRARDKTRMDQVLAYASGIEVYTSRHRPDIAARFRAYAEKHDKHWTSSTDDHQHMAYVRPPVGTPRRTVTRILAGS